MSINIHRRAENLFNISSDNGSVTLNVSQLRGCCGITFIYFAEWGDCYDHEMFCEELHELFTAPYNNAGCGWDDEEDFPGNPMASELNRAVLMVADAIGGESGEEYPSLWMMAQNKGWEESSISFNANSGNDIAVYTYHRPTDEYTENS